MSHDYLWSGALDEDQVITYVRACAACVRACVCRPTSAHPRPVSLSRARYPAHTGSSARFGTFGTSSDVFAWRLADPDGFNYSADRRADERLPGLAEVHDTLTELGDYACQRKVQFSDNNVSTSIFFSL